MSDLPPMLVALPILGAVATMLVGLVRSETGWPVAVLTSVLQVGAAGVLARGALRHGPVRYAVGGFAAPYGIELVVDGLSATMALLVASVALGVLAYARKAGPRSNPFYATYLLLVGGLTGISVTGDVFNMYVFLEISGLATYALVASGDRGESALAALKYLLVGTFGASLFLLGIGYAYVATGTLNMADLSAQLAEAGHTTPLVVAAFSLMVVGLFVKVAVFPLHAWQPTAYAGAPDTVSGLISALVSTVAAYALIRIVFTVFTVDFLHANPSAWRVLVAGSVASIVTGSLLAVSQSEIKRMLAYSSVSQFGLIVGAVAVANVTALTGAAIHLVGHAVMKGGLFLTTGTVAGETGARTVDDYGGLAKRFPAGSGVFGILAFALVGVPPAVGFVGKLYIVLGAIEAGAWLLASVIVGSTLLTLAYVARLVERMFFWEPEGEGRGDGGDGAKSASVLDEATGGEPGGASRGMKAAVLAAAVVAVVLGAAAFGYGQLIEPTILRLVS
ncbi:MAG: NADH-quinone oxidoreductase subunit N [Methanonatronarchaeales archaeon]|nr:NADH-quinone oxidoreductase subunit N [Methanonatronarchaeales archaeon]